LSRLIYRKNNIIIDDCNLTRAERSFYLGVLRGYKKAIKQAPEYVVECHCLDTRIGDVRKNAEARMALGGDRLNKTDFVKRWRMREAPSYEEGFAVIVEIPFERDEGNTYVRPAIFFSLPAVVFSVRNHMVPIKPEDVRIFPDVDRVFARYYEEGYLFIGVANLPLIGSKQVREQTAQECIIEVIKRLTPPIDDVFYSPHRLADKHESSLPNPYFAFRAREEHRLCLLKSVMVGCTSTDREFAKNAGIGRFLDRKTFFKDGKPRVKSVEPKERWSRQCVTITREKFHEQG